MHEYVYFCFVENNIIYVLLVAEWNKMLLIHCVAGCQDGMPSVLAKP